MSLPPDPIPNPIPNRTPFDNDLLQDPDAPRHTQPLPAQTPSLQTPPLQTSISSTGNAPNTPLPSGPSTIGGAPALPRQVVINDDANTPKTGVLPKKMPLSFIVGLAAVGGALAVILISTAFGRLLSRPQNENASQIPIFTPTPNAPRVVMIPSAPTPQNAEELPTPETSQSPTPQSTPQSSTSEPQTIAPNGTSAQPQPQQTPLQTPSASSSKANETPTPVSNNSSSDADSNSSNARDSTSDNGVYRSQRHNYSIQAPSGFRLIKKGRRTNWHGPDDTKLLVEVGGAGSESPRESWEKLERALQKKYGAKYRSQGIRETQINGRQAAVWEFELDTKSGKVRKMDVAIHQGKKGFAVLATAPVDKFETWRPQFDKAIQSLQIENNATPTPTPNGY